MKPLLLLLFLLSSLAKAQLTTINPDTVCLGSSGSLYQIPIVPLATDYIWTVASPGSIISGQGTQQIQVDWSSAGPGLIGSAVSVEVITSCPSTPVTLDVFVLSVNPIIDPLGPFCSSDPCVPLVASPLGGQFIGSGVVGSTFCPSSALLGINSIQYVYTLGGCTFTSPITVSVNGSQSIGPIQHD